MPQTKSGEKSKPPQLMGEQAPLTNPIFESNLFSIPVRQLSVPPMPGDEKLCSISDADYQKWFEDVNRCGLGTR
ncbi:Uncharacterised protein [uncultured archaeon]|nr:Uncharacterised protein [uncultured archaeon]